MASATLIAPPERHAPSRRSDRGPTCLGRHRVYFELDDDRSADPVMNRICPGCGHGLPGKSPA